MIYRAFEWTVGLPLALLCWRVLTTGFFTLLDASVAARQPFSVHCTYPSCTFVVHAHIHAPHYAPLSQTASFIPRRIPLEPPDARN